MPALALDPGRSLSQYVYQNWGPEQGFPGGIIYAISRSKDGFLWIGTDQGLIRFDGYRFDLIQQPIPSMPPIGRVRGLALDAQGVLWILLDGAHLLIYRDGHFEDAFASFNIRNMTFSAMSLDNAGNILLSAIGSVTLRGGNGKLSPIANGESIPGTVISITEARDGRILIGTQDGVLFAVKEGHVSQIARLGDTKIDALLPASNGGIWVGTDHGIRFLTADDHLIDSLPGWTRQQQIMTMLRDHNGCTWAGTQEGLLRITPGDEVTFRRSVDGSEVNAIFEDQEGDLWFGGPGGMERLQDGVFTNYSAAEGFPEIPTGPIFADVQGVVWFAPLSGGLYWYKDGRLRKVLQDGLDSDVIYSIDGGDDEIWVGRQHGGLTRILCKGDTLVTHTYTEKDGLAQNSVYAVHRSPSGAVWAGTVSGGVSIFRGSGFEKYSTLNGLGSNAVNSITESDGTIWMATPSGLEEYRGGNWTNRTVKNGLPSANVRLCFADSHGVVWIATDAGLAYLSGGHVTTLQNLPNQMREQILGITEDQLGYLWFSTSYHVLRVKREALLTDSQHLTDIESYGISDGLSGIEAVRRERSLMSDSSGRVWISLSRGIAVGDPKLTYRDSLPIRVRIDSATANGKSINLSESANVPAGTRSMTFNYQSDSLFAPDRVRFRYRLAGADPGWSDAVESRQVSYHNLSPGKYRFEVIASREGRLWNSPETVYSFSIDPTFWQSWWFRTAAAFATLMTVLLVFQLRSIRLSQQLHARFQDRLAERTRIAQELHDTLLQSFQGLMLRFQSINNMLPARPTEAKKALEEALDRADDALNESRSAIQNIRSSPSQASNLAQALNSMMAAMADEYPCDGTRKPNYSVVIEGTPKRLNRGVNSEILRIARESLRNSFQHAGASRIEAEVTFGESLFRIRFRDDGAGIDPDVLKHGSRLGHWGMIGIKERAAQIGAKVDVWSKPGAGTELELSVPAQIAYDGFEAKTPFRALKKRFEKRS
jgi:signal transduction histidine kinase/ligand-binding sensor domain-containing protein